MSELQKQFVKDYEAKKQAGLVSMDFFCIGHPTVDELIEENNAIDRCIADKKCVPIPEDW